MSPPTARGEDLAAVSGFDEATRAALEQEIFRQIEAGWRDTVDLPLATLMRKPVNTGHRGRIALVHKSQQRL